MTDKLRALTDHPELRALMEQFYAAPTEREVVLEALAEKADALYPDWQEIWAAAVSDGRIMRALAIHCVLRIRERSDLDEFERFKAKTAEADFVTSFDKVTASPNASAAFRMTLAFYELMRIARLDPEEMKELTQQVVSDRQQTFAKTPRKDKPRVAHAKVLACEIAKENSRLWSVEIAEEIPNRWRMKDVPCLEHDWLVRLVRKWRRKGDIPPQTPGRRRRTDPMRRVSPRMKFSQV